MATQRLGARYGTVRMQVLFSVRNDISVVPSSSEYLFGTIRRQLTPLVCKFDIV